MDALKSNVAYCVLQAVEDFIKQNPVDDEGNTYDIGIVTPLHAQIRVKPKPLGTIKSSAPRYFNVRVSEMM